MMEILFEDQHVMVINKPAGLSTESGNAGHPSAEKEALELFRRSHKGFLPRQPYLRAVHRLDRASSGVLVLAKSKAALSRLMTQFEQREVEKTYQAWVLAAPMAPEGELQHWLKRDETGKKALIFDREIAGTQPAALQYRVLEKKGEETMLEIQPKTGRFHQIRAQLAHVGCPIVGDVLYGGVFWREHEIKLHASRLVFYHPFTQEQISVEAPWNLPE